MMSKPNGNLLSYCSNAFSPKEWQLTVQQCLHSRLVLLGPGLLGLKGESNGGLWPEEWWWRNAWPGQLWWCVLWSPSACPSSPLELWMLTHIGVWFLVFPHFLGTAADAIRETYACRWRNKTQLLQKKAATEMIQAMSKYIRSVWTNNNLKKSLKISIFR